MKVYNRPTNKSKRELKMQSSWIAHSVKLIEKLDSQNYNMPLKGTLKGNNYLHNIDKLYRLSMHVLSITRFSHLEQSFRVKSAFLS